ncbi:MAG TPA: phenylacetic acid degradation bifunctional protein PaaZ [Flavobacteriales bacterium]|nr:phenylacetic acid degradation bifunctional protein PaaZ [Flavobacteriales bacterium]HIO16158.1 phenylacetic acid degradation bifunctional protein PaaZ [Flavobacteriales bacterium]
MKKLKNLVEDRWIEGNGAGNTLYNAITGEAIASASTDGVDIGSMYEYARSTGGFALRRMTFQERGRMLKKLALHLHSCKEKFYEVSAATGATRIDSWIDIEGGIGNLFANASLRRKLPDSPFAVDGDFIPLSKEGTFGGHHILVPKEGVAVHINAYNFPIWGMLEKIAVNLLAGVPAIVKPATVTSFLTEYMVREIHSSGILPKGSLQLVCGSARDILDFVDERDIVTFTGSATTGRALKVHPRIIENSVPFNLEADSLNAAILGPDAGPGTPEFDLFVKEIRKEMTVKCGQKCTAVRRIMVPEQHIDAFQDALTTQLAKTVIGDPSTDGVRMGALVGQTQRDDVRSQIALLKEESEIVFGSPNEVDVIGADSNIGAFMSPVLLRVNNSSKAVKVHEVEAFGPVSTLMSYNEVGEAVALSKKGKGSLCCSITTHDKDVATEFVRNAACMHGRILVLDRECAKESTGHGSPLPLLVHGGPGRAGGGEEMGGLRGVRHYMQRTAIQGHPSMLTAITSQYQPGAAQPESEPHVFRKHFEELKVGDTVTTAKHTVTEADISNFANVSGDNFYAHVDATSLEGTLFEQRVAHGYFILSKAAGLFVDPKKGPVLLNYGIEECRFTKPVYPGATIGVRLTVKEKISQERREPEDVAKGIVKFQVDVYDETGETVAIATILTMVKMLDQSPE